MGWFFIVLVFFGCVDENGKPLEINWQESKGDCLVQEHYRSNGVWFTICHMKNKTEYMPETAERRA